MLVIVGEVGVAIIVVAIVTADRSLAIEFCEVHQLRWDSPSLERAA